MNANDLQLIAAKPLRELLGGISDMTLWRWVKANKIPQPIIAQHRCRRFWRLADIATWQAGRVIKHGNGTSQTEPTQHDRSTRKTSEQGDV